MPNVPASGETTRPGRCASGAAGHEGRERAAPSAGNVDFQYLKAWMESRTQQGESEGSGSALREELEGFFTHIFNKSADGISILALDFTILGVNTTIRGWYGARRPLVGRKCFEAYHARREPCPHCPCKVTLRTGHAHVGTVPYQVSGRIRGDQELSVFPLHDDAGQLLCLLEYVRDITGLTHDARVVQALKRRLQFQDQTLRDQETALAVLLRQGGDVERRVAEGVALELEATVLPALAKLRALAAAGPVARELALLQARLHEVIAGRPGRARALRGLTGREREVASLVRQGESSKEIAARLCVTPKAVEFHRTNIRRKLAGGARAPGSLRNLLLDLEDP